MADFEKMYSGSWYTITGAAEDEEWQRGYQEMFDELGIGTISRWVSFSGAEMNSHYGLTDANAYPDGLHFLAFPLDGLDIGKLAAFKLRMRDRWFDDIVDNDVARQRQIDRSRK